MNESYCYFESFPDTNEIIYFFSDSYSMQKLYSKIQCKSENRIAKILARGIG